ncbi:haloacid dehalogenase [Sulfolobus sp. A20]|uniref:haloacid dehalogenase n=1 Tax=Sulfolobaceae TaxID=118883 RepID=UPI000845D115|nr:MULTISPECIES: haloacid dehalogenase [unclassified Sulfolobus]TRM74391.1 haloacid dehalogenase [Sulfolobus sp. B5]TRM75559.1 haloacid dehalogenase [Sulfolobus sp. A20-N-F8]TRM81297.1 haloacid dehalogenase [Sulfolobus sp. D5]TRM82393.1 haloacid dehalogenase [Sulfolobus sp. A20-N-F6]TRM88416.1 haloacid dehalogenase [Sulfolobus sp. E3]TRM89264.1 haloacid dehalogenase [Sulfolobus sp. C3]TRM94479.1 haloacid dehalogenase [Sulfolobus sp. A20-N-G8]TRM98305.1 haloacid dehalogenase [Sulfolobus sp. 
MSNEILEEIKRYLGSVNNSLLERFDSREKLLLLARELIRYCGETISLSHRGKKEEALKKYHQAIEKANEIRSIIKNFPEMLYGDVGTAFQELAEATVIISMYFSEKLKLPNELGIPDIYYITGIADAIGEMRRRVLELLKRSSIDEAEKIYNIMEELYELLWGFEYPKSLVPGLRQKIDALRKILEETNHDIFLAKIGKS